MAWARTRRAAVAGRFYPGDPQGLDRAVQGHLRPDRAARKVHAMVAPHAGYIYSGAIAGETYSSVEVPGTAVILSPNHTGHGLRRSLWSGGGWEIPGATVPIDEDLRHRVLLESNLELDTAAHQDEHAIEVHLPFLHARNPDVRIVPIVLGRLSLAECIEVGEGLARAVAAAPTPVLLVASTDMSHFLPAAEAATVDRLAMEQVQAMDPGGLYRTVHHHQISMCGFVPTTVTLVAALAGGARRAQLIRYGHSGETTGDMDRVVGYAGFVVD